MIAAIGRLTGVELKDQGPAVLMGVGHCGTHWIAGVFYVLLPFVTRDLGLSYAQAGTIVAVFHASSALTNVGSGAVVDISGRKVVFSVVALALGGAALLGFGMTAHYLVLCVLTVLIGASNNLWHPPAIAFLSETYPANRGYALSVHALGANLGDTIAPPVAGALIALASWESTARLGAIPAFAVAAVIAALLLRHDRPRVREAHEEAGLVVYLRGLAEIVRRRDVLGLCLMAGFRSMTQNGLYVFLPLYLIDVVGTGPVLMGLALMAMQLGGVVAAPIAGTWSDRVGRRPVVLAGLSTTTVVVAALTVIHHELAFVAGVSLLGFALFAVRPVVHSWMMDLTPPALAGSATSLLFGTQSVLSAAVPVIGGLLADAYGLPVVFYLLAATMLIANVLVYLLPGEARTLTAR